MVWAVTDHLRVFCFPLGRARKRWADQVGGLLPWFWVLDYMQVEVRGSTLQVLLRGSSYHGKRQSLLSLWIPPPTTQSLGTLCFAAGVLQVH